MKPAHASWNFAGWVACALALSSHAFADAVIGIGAYHWDRSNLKGPYRSLAVKATDVIGLHPDGSITCWGSDIGGRVSNTPAYSDAVQVAAGSGFSLIRHADGRVDAIGALLGAWGTANDAADPNHDGSVNGPDLGILLGHWGACP